jgi:hypothetical protein
VSIGQIRSSAAALGLLALLGLVLLSGCAGYGGETVGAAGNHSGRIQSDKEYCALTLPEGWTWRPAAWAAVSPLGTEMAFADYLYGRPQYAEWEEDKAARIEQVTRRTLNVQITETEDSLRIDYGPQGGLAVLQRFDRVGCHLTFSNSDSSARAQEIAVWEQIIASLERTSPDPNYTPVAR